MDNNTQDQAVQQDQDKSQETDSTDIQSLIQAEVEKSVSTFKNEISGLNKKVSAVTKERDEAIRKAETLELERLSDEERAKAEIEKARAEKEQIEQETALLKRERIIEKTLLDTGLPLEFAKRINGKDEESILEDVQELSNFVNEYIKKGIDEGITKRLSGKQPEGSLDQDLTTEKGKLIAAYNDAEKRGDAQSMMKIKDQIRSLK